MPIAQRDQEGILTALNACILNRRLIVIEYLAKSTDELTRRTVEPYLLRGKGSDWYLEAYDRDADGERTFRLDRMRLADPQAETFVPRTGLGNLDPSRTPSGRSGIATILFLPSIAARETEGLHDVSDLVDGSALARVPYGSERWLALTVLKHRGEAVLIEPEPLRRTVASRAGELLTQLALPDGAVQR